MNNNHPRYSNGSLGEHAPGTLSAYDMKGNLQWQAQLGAHVGAIPAGEDHVKQITYTYWYIYILDIYIYDPQMMWKYRVCKIYILFVCFYTYTYCMAVVTPTMSLVFLEHL